MVRGILSPFVCPFTSYRATLPVCESFFVNVKRSSGGKVCQASIPSLTRGRPMLPTPVLCSVCGAKRAYRPSEVFIGTVRRIWK
jgi:hypothetical protein